MINAVRLAGLAALASVAAATEHAFESSPFNVAKALRDHGVDFSKIPELSGCRALGNVYGDHTVYRESPNATQYSDFTGKYWSKIQSDVDPHCIFVAPTADSVSVMVLLSRLTQCPFAVKSGGHGAFAGASNIEGGMTVSLEMLRNVTLSDGKETVVIQPGNTWSDVYTALDKHELTVTGGRVSSVGTGGLTLGGGISFFSNLHGWACDNVVRYEVITASGVKVDATPTSHPDLYWALRGGGNNFGIVTAFTFETLPLPDAKIWGGSKTYLEAAFEDVEKAYHNLVVNSPQDPNAGMWLAWAQMDDLKVAVAELYYAKPNGSESTLFKGFNEAMAVEDTTKERVVHEYTDLIEASNRYDLRELYWAITAKATLELATFARNTFYEKRSAVSGVAGADPVLIMHPITEGQIESMSKNGGNALGVTPEDGPLYIIQIASWWDDAEGDQAMYTFASDVISTVAAKAEELGVDNDYVYMNYGSKYQNVIASYGAENVAKLNAISKRYDPQAVFQKLQPGYFKLNRSPAPGSEL
ncbi:FAD/FMN-containing dehydrogenase [Geosmithia morbida]|uniref:FAD/FMN-containing dehydrogenase n=1 Tax=Geosmithia morbida TaxID=1094350 RepID=A0A9P5CYN7_9HYPO|nr:FAD/FMN-containing dehydrogenase [Geosmithia morbida]KAF4119597.1 FAD/FMN-containing dehydrogenase [Geosmithia morbida]